jgi:hypothetical protein
MPAIGRIANYSSLRKHRPRENQIYDSYFGNFELNILFYYIFMVHNLKRFLSVVANSITPKCTKIPIAGEFKEHRIYQRDYSKVCGSQLHKPYSAAACVAVCHLMCFR